MKACHNCRALYADEYNGTCNDCGAGMGGQSGNTSLESRFAAQQSEASRSRMVENQVESKNYDGIRKGNPIFDAAHEFVMDFRSPEQRERDEVTGA